jgi:probable rRNA maturation factor
MIHVSRDKCFPKEMKLTFIRRLARETFKISKITADITIVFTDNPSIRKLNKEYRKIDAITDVLSFPSDEIDPQTDIRYLGDIIISLDRAQDQAFQAGRTISDELSMLIVHGCLHLSGYDHTSQTEKETMKNLQESILLSQGISNYSWPEEE